MKRILLLLVLSASAVLPSVAAEPQVNIAATETFYIQLVSRTRATDRDSYAQVEIGREFVALTGMGDGYAATIRKRRFTSLLDGLNALAANGWRLAATSSAMQGGMNVTVWTLEKTVENRSELLDGLAE